MLRSDWFDRTSMDHVPTDRVPTGEKGPPAPNSRADTKERLGMIYAVMKDYNYVNSLTAMAKADFKLPGIGSYAAVLLYNAGIQSFAQLVVQYESGRREWLMSLSESEGWKSNVETTLGPSLDWFISVIRSRGKPENFLPSISTRDGGGAAASSDSADRVPHEMLLKMVDTQNAIIRRLEKQIGEIKAMGPPVAKSLPPPPPPPPNAAAFGAPPPPPMPLPRATVAAPPRGPAEPKKRKKTETPTAGLISALKNKFAKSRDEKADDVVADMTAHAKRAVVPTMNRNSDVLASAREAVALEPEAESLGARDTDDDWPEDLMRLCRAIVKLCGNLEACCSACAHVEVSETDGWLPTLDLLGTLDRIWFLRETLERAMLAVTNPPEPELVPHAELLKRAAGESVNVASREIARMDGLYIAAVEKYATRASKDGKVPTNMALIRDTLEMFQDNRDATRSLADLVSRIPDSKK